MYHHSPFLKNHHTFDVAPIKIVEHYEQFKDAIKNGDFARVRENLIQMRRYQGGEKLARGLESEFKEEMKQFDVPEELPEMLLSAEEKAKQVLSCLDLFEGFLADFRFDLAHEQVQKIRSLGDDAFAQNLEQELVKAQAKALKKNHIQKAQVSLEELEEKESLVSTKLFLELQTLLQTSFPDAVRLFEEKHEFLDERAQQKLQKEMEQAFQNYKKQTEDAFFEAIEGDRTTLANNIIEKSVLSQEDKRRLLLILESKKEDNKEESRIAKMQEASAELDSALIAGDFKTAQKLLTKLKHLTNEDEFKTFEQRFFQAENKEQFELAEAMKRAFEKNISEKNFELAKKNLKDLKKMLSLADYQACVQAFDHAAVLAQKLEHTAQFWKNHHQKRFAFERAMHALHHKNEKDLIDAKKQLVDLGEGEVSLFFDRVKTSAPVQESDTRETFVKLLDEQAFAEAENFLKKENISEDDRVLFQKQLDERKRFSAIQSLILEHQFESARKHLEKEKQSSFYLDALTFLHQEERNLLYAQTEKQVRELENQLQSLFQKKDFSGLKTAILGLLELGNPEKFQTWKERIETMESAEAITGIEEEIQKLKQLGKFDEALKKSEELLSRSASLEYQKMQMEIAYEKSRFERAKYEGFVAFLRQEIDAGKKDVIKKSRSKLKEEDVQHLEKYLAEKEFARVQSERKSEAETLQQALSQADLAGKKEILGKLASYSDFVDLTQLQAEFQQSQKEQEEKNLAELLHRIHYALLQEDFEEVKTLARELAVLDSEEASAMMQKCLEQEEEKAKKHFLNQIASLFHQMHRLCAEKKYEACSDILFSHEDIFAESILESERKVLLGVLEEVSHYFLETHQFSLVEKCIHFFQRFQNSQKAETLEKALKEQKRTRIEQLQLKGAKEFVRLKTVVAHYQSWKKDFQEGKQESSVYPKLVSLGEEQFVAYLQDFMSRKEEVVEASKISLLLQNNDLESVKQQGIEYFSQFSFSELFSLFRHFWTLEHVRKEEEKSAVFEKMKSNIQDFFDTEKRRKVSLKRFLPAENLVLIGENNANILLDFIHYKESAVSQAEKAELQKSFQGALQNQLWQDAEDLLWKMSFEDYVVSLQQLWDAQENAEKKMWELEWKEVSESLLRLMEERQFQEAWKAFEKAFARIPYKLFFHEFSSVFAQFELLFAQQMNSLKMAVYQHMEAGKITEAQKTLSELQKFEEEYLQEADLMKNHFQVLQELSSMLDLVLEKADFEKARALIQAHANDLESFDTQWLEYRIQKAESQEVYKKDLAQFEKATEALTSFDCAFAEDVLAEMHDARLSFLLQKNIEKTKEKIQQENLWKSWNDSLETSFVEAEKNLKNIADVSQYVQAVFVCHSHKFSFLEAEWKHIAQTLLKTIASASVQEADFQKAEDFLQAVFFVFEESFTWMEEYEHIWNELLQSQELFAQDQFEHFLTSGEMEKASSLIARSTYARLKFHFQHLFQVQDTKYSSSFIETQIYKASDALKKKDFEKAKSFLFACKRFPSIEVFERTMIALYNEEAEAVESTRISTLQMLQEDVKKSLQFQKWKQAEKIMQQIQALSLDGEYENVFALYQSARDVAQKEAVQNEKLQEEQRKKSKKQYEAFVWKALSDGDLPQASKFIGEIRNLGDNELADRMMEEYEEIYNERSRENKRKDLEEQIKLYISQKEWDKMAEVLLKSDGILDEKQLKQWRKQLEVTRIFRDKESLIQNIEEALAEHRYEKVAEILSLLKDSDTKLWKEFLQKARKQKQNFIHELIHKEKFAEAEALLEIF